MPHHLDLSLKPGQLAVCRLAPDAAVPAWASPAGAFSTVSRTDQELSIICPDDGVPAGVRKESGWRLFKVEGPLDFALTGILAAIASPLAAAGIGIFTIATYDTDYVMVKDENVDLAIATLTAAGHRVRR